jgi:hypothetical protein
MGQILAAARILRLASKCAKNEWVLVRFTIAVYIAFYHFQTACIAAAACYNSVPEPHQCLKPKPAPKPAAKPSSK